MPQSRRSFLGYTFALSASAPALAGVDLLDFLVTPQGTDRILSLLKQYLNLNDTHREVVSAFTRSLKSNFLHSEPPAVFQSLLMADASDESLAQYVIQEFVVSTTYLAWNSGAADTLSFAGRRVEA